ncbi:MAG: hypothetical protein DRP03_02265 [Candidatus Aenigmatarchaeota archaeon]|nr:MAG: hypothetical protein DRP03_02265 [Candidatus Aenigmarchaeota archaeon]
MKYLPESRGSYEYIENVYRGRSQEYREKCKVLARLSNELQQDIELCTRKLEDISNISGRDQGLLRRIYLKMRSLLQRYPRERVLEELIKAEVRSLGELKNRLGEKISYGEQEVQIANQRINELYELEMTLVEELSTTKQQLEEINREIEELGERLGSYDKEPDSNLDLVKERLELEQAKRVKEMKMGEYESEILTATTLQTQIRNLRDAYKILIDKGLTLAIKNAKVAYSHITGTYDALEKMVPGKIAVAGVTQMTLEAMKTFARVKEDMNYVFEIITKASAELPQVVPLFEEPFYSDDTLETASQRLEKGKELFNQKLGAVLGKSLPEVKSTDMLPSHDESKA